MACVVLLAISFYFEFVLGMQPCLLCILQRWALGLLGLVFLMAGLHHTKKLGSLVYCFIALLMAAGGIAASARQVWLQHQPPRPEETCIPGLNFLLQTRPLPDVIKLMFQGGRECAEVTWRFLGLTMAEWTLAIFIIFSVIIIWLIFRIFLNAKVTVK
jgi:disulfide bond formation protein DsbB